MTKRHYIEMNKAKFPDDFLAREMLPHLPERSAPDRGGVLLPLFRT
jgi:hypothetical protein